jgi:hypothetical protein
MPRSAPVDGFCLAYDRHGAGDPVVLRYRLSQARKQLAAALDQEDEA